MFDTEQIDDDLYRISLEKSGEFPPPANRTNNVFLLTGDAPALINTGHPSQYDALCKALHELEVTPGEVERVVATSWNVDNLGAASDLPGADVFALSSDMVEPRDWEGELEDRRAAFRELAESIVEQYDYQESQLGDVDDFLGSYLPRGTHRLDIVPIRGGHTVAAGDYAFEVIATPGPQPGHLALWDHDRGVLFCGDLTMRGMPRLIEDVQPYLVSLERLLEIEDAERMLPNYGPVEQRPRWTIKRCLNFLNNFLSNAPAAMHSAPTVMEFIDGDLGHPVESLPEMVFQWMRYQRPMDELVRSRMIEAAGRGMDKKYGVDVDDPRDRLRKATARATGLESSKTVDSDDGTESTE